jgi:hypothetical protein
MPSITLTYTDAEWRAITEEAAAQQRKPNAFCRAAPLDIARARQFDRPAKRYQPLEHIPIGSTETQHSRNREPDPGADQ